MLLHLANQRWRCVTLGCLLTTFVSSFPSLALASEGGEDLGRRMPLWSVFPFALLLIMIAVLPLLAPRFWERNSNKALVSFLLGAPIVTWIFFVEPAAVLHTAHEYVAFIILLATLYIISGGVVVRGTLAGTPGLNAVLLGIGAILASFIGTTGAAMLLIRPLLRANSVRQRQGHVVVFFIFIVANAGGLLTPLGDPPLFLGFLRGVPFTWTFSLWREWLFVVVALLIVFYIIDSTIFRREDLDTPGDLDKVAIRHQVPISIAGKQNLAYLLAVIAIIYATGTLNPPPGVQEIGMLLIAALSLVTTPRRLHDENAFAFAPIIEVAVLFVGIFATMIPALAILNARGGELGLHEPWHFFWASGLLSSFLDNAPTYLTFASAASGLVGTDAAHLGELLHSPHGREILTAISLGSVLMGANTYIGNGPNFMVKAVAEQAGVCMPSFFGYMAYSVAILIPLFAVMTFVFF